MHNLSDIAFLNEVHRGADIELHTRILFGNLQVAGMSFEKLYNDCVLETQTGVGAWKIFRRIQRAFTLARYVEYAHALAAPKVECGVFQGFSARMTCRILAALKHGFDGNEYFMIDSFEGLSAPVAEDSQIVTRPDGNSDRVQTHTAGHFAVDLATVAARFKDYPRVRFVKGWIPQAFAALPQTSWSFVHIDVDLYEPTLACLEYFMPRLVPGGVIVNDDFSSPYFPGGGKAWAEFFARGKIPYAVLDTGQSIYIRPN